MQHLSQGSSRSLPVYVRSLTVVALQHVRVAESRRSTAARYLADIGVSDANCLALEHSTGGDIGAQRRRRQAMKVYVLKRELHHARGGLGGKSAGLLLRYDRIASCVVQGSSSYAGSRGLTVPTNVPDAQEDPRVRSRSVMASLIIVCAELEVNGHARRESHLATPQLLYSHTSASVSAVASGAV
jgi:hypothetical protein